MSEHMDTPRENTSMRRTRIVIVAVFALLAAGIIAPPLLSGDTSPPSVEWTLLPAAKAPWLPLPGGAAVNWLYATTAVPTVRYVCLIGWAAFATILAGLGQWRCHRWHYGAADVEAAKWDEPIPTVTEPGRDTEKAAS